MQGTVPKLQQVYQHWTACSAISRSLLQPYDGSTTYDGLFYCCFCCFYATVRKQSLYC